MLPRRLPYADRTKTRVLVAGAGPIGLRIAIEMCALGHEVRRSPKITEDSRRFSADLSEISHPNIRAIIPLPAADAEVPTPVCCAPHAHLSHARCSSRLQVTVIEPRDTCSRLNILKLWPETTDDLEQLGLPMVDPKWCTKHGGYTTASTSRLQLALLKVPLTATS